MPRAPSVLRFARAALVLAIVPLLKAETPPADVENIAFVGESGRTADEADLTAAFKQLAQNGGTIVLRGSVRISGSFMPPVHAAHITLTDSHAGNDYRRTNGAKLILAGDYAVNGPTTFASLLIVTEGKAVRIFCDGKKVLFAKELSSRKSLDADFPSIVGATRKTDGADVTIDGGEWNTVSGGALQDSTPTSGTLRVTINGGRFHGTVYAVGASPHKGDAELILNNGAFLGGVAGLGNHTGASMLGDIRVTINGGAFNNTIAASRNADAEFAGSYTLTINGGNFISVTDVIGTRGLRGGATSSLAAQPALLDAENSGTLSFTNPLVRGADPWVFFHDGYYYSTSTGGSQLSGRKVTNLPDLGRAIPVTYWKPAPGKPWSKNIWSPKIYRFTAEEVGEKNAGWYLYFTANDGTDNSAADHHMYVMRGLTDDPFGPYGSPIDGTPDEPVRIIDPAGKVLHDGDWVAGPKILYYGGKRYLIWVGRVGDRNSENVGDHSQFICLDELVNPWTIAGNRSIICRPTHEWEKRGAGVTYAGNRGRRMLPEVVEGGTPVISADGSLYILYAGSGYWTRHYAIGLLKLTGTDPMNPAHWKKFPQPIFRASEEVNGTGNACYVQSPTGKTTWAIYHAYIGKAGGSLPRYMFAEPYIADAKRVSIGKGQPLPLGTPLKIEVNPMPLRKKIRNFDKLPPSSP